MTTKEVAKYLGLHRATVTKYAAKGEILAVWIGRAWRFDKEGIDKWISEGHKKPQKNEKPKSIKKSKAKAKLKITKKPVKVSAAATVLAVIKRSRKGVDVATTDFPALKASFLPQGGRKLALRAGKSVVSFRGSKKRAKSRIGERAFM